MTSLTEQWKKGELPDGFYWCDVDIYEDGNITKQIESFIHHHPVFYWETSIVRVIELAPSFSEYKSMQDENTKLKKWCEEFNALEVAKENTKLKELLKECRSPINYALCLNLSEEEKIEFKNLLAKIKQVLGEE